MRTNSTAAAVYVRISEDHQDGLGVRRQEEACRDLADRMGLTVTAVYTDNDISAFKGKHRPGFTDLKDAMAAGEVGAVLAYAPDRISRDVVESEVFKRMAVTAGVRLVYVLGGELDMDDPNAALFSRMSSIIGSWESEIKGRRVAAAAKQRALAGLPPNGGRRYGYRFTEDRNLELVEHEARAFRETVENILAGASVRSQVIRLNELGEDYWAPERKGIRRRWSGASLRRSLLRKDAAGLVRYRDQDFPEVKAQWPAIITLEQHRAIVALLTAPERRTNNRPGRSAAYLGTGLYRCGGCGDTLVSVYNGKTKDGTVIRAYICRNAEGTRHNTDKGRGHHHVAARMIPVDAVVTSTVLQRLAMPDVQNQVAAAQATTVDVQGLMSTRRALQVELSELGEAIGRGDLTVAQGAAASRGLQNRLDSVTRELESVDQSGVLVDVAAASLDPHAWWEAAPLSSRRAVLDALATVTVDRAVRRGGGAFDPSRVRVEWKI